MTETDADLKETIVDAIDASMDYDWTSKDAAQAVMAIPLVMFAIPMRAALIQYRDDLRRPPSGDSITRRLKMVEALIGEIE